MASSTNPLYEESSKFYDYSKIPYSIDTDYRGVTDFGDLLGFAPYETGYCFLAVLSEPNMGIIDEVQNAFVSIIEKEFKGLSGIEDIVAESGNIGTSTSTVQYINSVSSSNTGTITMNFTEKTGTILTKYITKYLHKLRNPYNKLRNYGVRYDVNKDDGSLNLNMDKAYDTGVYKETFTLLYVITDSTCLQVEKAFLLLNAQPTTASYSELYNAEKGSLGTKEITIPWNVSVRDGKIANCIAQKYIEELIKTDKNTEGKVKLNSYNFNWSISGINGEVTKTEKLVLDIGHNGEYAFRNGASDPDIGSVAKSFRFNDSTIDDLYKAADYDPTTDSYASALAGKIV